MGSDGERDETGGERGCEGRRRGRGERQVRVRERGDQWSATGDKRLGRARTSWGPRHIGDSAAEKEGYLPQRMRYLRKGTVSAL